MTAADRVSLFVLGSAAFLVSADARVIDPLLKIIAAEFHVPQESAALTVSAYALPYGLCQLFYGPLGDRVGKIRVMAVAMALFSVGTAACAMVPNLWTFIAPALSDRRRRGGNDSAVPQLHRRQGSRMQTASPRSAVS